MIDKTNTKRKKCCKINDIGRQELLILIFFSSMATHKGLFYAKRFGNHTDFTFSV